MYTNLKYMYYMCIYIHKVFYNIKTSYKAETYFVIKNKKFQAFQPSQNL